MGSCTKFRYLLVILLSASISDCGVAGSTYRMKKSKQRSSGGSIFKDGHKPSNTSTFQEKKQLLYVLKNAVAAESIPTTAFLIETSKTESASSNTDSTNYSISSSIDSNPSNLRVGPSGNLPAEQVANWASFPSLLELIALQPNPNVVRPTIASLFTTTTSKTTTVTASTTTEFSSSSTDTSSTTEVTSSSETPSPAPDSTSASSMDTSTATESSSPATDSTSTTSTSSSDTSTATEASSLATDSTSTTPTSSTDTSTATELSSLATDSTSTTPTSSTDTSTTTESSSLATDSTSSTSTSTATESSSPATDSTSTTSTSSTDTSTDTSTATESSSLATDSTSTTPTSSTDTSTITESSSLATDSTTTTPSSTTTESSSPATDSTSTTPTSPTDSSTATESSSLATDSTSTTPSSATTESSSPASDSTSTTPTSPTDTSTSSVAPNPLTDSTSTSSATETSIPPLANLFEPSSTIVQPPNIVQFFPAFGLPSSGGNAASANDSPLGQLQGAASQLLAINNIPSIFNSTAGGISALSSLPNITGISIPSIPTFGDVPIANDSPLEQIQTTASQLLASSNVPSIFNSTAAGISSIASNAGISIPQIPALGDASVANDSPINQIQTTASQLLASSNVPNIFNNTAAGISNIASNAGITVPQIPTLGDTPLADSPINQIQSAATQLLASSNIPGIFNSSAGGLSGLASLPNITGISIPTLPTLGDAPVANDSPINQIQTAASQLLASSNIPSVFNSTAAGISGIASNAGIPIPQIPTLSGAPAADSPINQIQTATSQLLASSNIPSIFNTTVNGINSFASPLPGINIPQIPTLGDTPVANDRPIAGGVNFAANPLVNPTIPNLSNFQSQLQALASQLSNVTVSFPNNPPTQSDSLPTKPHTNPVSSANIRPTPPATDKHPLLTIFPQQATLSDSYFGLPTFSITNNTFGQFISQIVSNFTGGASNATSTNSTDSSNSNGNPLQSLGSQISAGFANVAEVISNGTAAIGNLGSQIANQTSSTNGTNTNNSNETSAAIPDPNQFGGTLSQLISNGTNFIVAPISSLLPNFSSRANPSLTDLFNQLSTSVASNETGTQLINALSPSALTGQLNGLISQLQASNPLASNDASVALLQDTSLNGILNWNAVNKFPVINNWIGTNSNNKPFSIAKPTLSCPVCQEVCGKVNPTAKQRVIGGTVVDPANKYPWTARFVYFNSNAGQGSLINDRAVVTTATTVNGMPLFSQATALFNVYDTMSTEEQRISKGVAKVVPHPKYTPDNPFDNNIGIVMLDSPIAMSEFVQPICLPTQFDSYAGTQAVVAGWGADRIGGHSSPVPHEISIPLYSQVECRLANGNLSSNNLCGGVVHPAQSASVKSTCEGDDGAALMAPSRIDPSVLTLIGVTIETPGTGCGSPNQPAVFTNVQNYIDFILYNGIGCGC